jgi:hypothetical protein
VDSTKVQLAWRLARHSGCRDIDETEHVAEVLLRRLHEDRTRVWTRSDLICHETLKRVDEHPERTAAPMLFGDGATYIAPTQ